MSAGSRGSSDTMISLQWSHFESFILKGISNLHSSIEQFADVTLVCGDGKSFKAHKIVLSMWSPYFRDIFLNNICEHPVIILRDFRSEDMEVILHFIYEGQAYLLPENETRILETAVSLQIAGFAQMKEPTQIISSSTPSVPTTSGNEQNLTSIGSPAGLRLGQRTPQKQGTTTIVNISPIPTTTPTKIQKTTMKTVEISPKSKSLPSSSSTPVYKPHKRQKIELTPTKSITPSPSKMSGEPQPDLTTMYSMDQQRIIIADQEIPRCSSTSQELEFIEIINISPDQNSVTLNISSELDPIGLSGPNTLEPATEVVMDAPSFIFGTPTTSEHPCTTAQVQTIVSAGPSTNHRNIITTTEQKPDPGNGNIKTMNLTIKTDDDHYVRVPCPRCGKFVKETSLRVHMARTHLEEGTILVCPICSKVINSKGVYYKHMFLHRRKGQQLGVKRD